MKKKEKVPVQEDKMQNYDYVDDLIEESIRKYTLYEHGNNEECDYWTVDHNANTSISVSNSLHNTFMSLLFLPEKYHISI
jgi:hypothetical protein